MLTSRIPSEVAEANRIALANDRLCHHVAHRFAWTGIDHEDLYQIGFIGLRNAALKIQQSSKPFDSKGFGQFAISYITGAIMHFLRDHGSLVRVPRQWRELYAKGRKSKDPMQLLKISKEHWEVIVEAHACQHYEPLVEEIYEQMESGDNGGGGQIPEVAQAELLSQLNCLPKKEFRILQLLLQGKSHAAIISRMAISQKELNRRLITIKALIECIVQSKNPINC